MIHHFGIRHHGPGCARSLLRALEDLAPDCLLVEGPPEADKLLEPIVHEEMQPPVALLVYCPDEVQLASFFPFAEFSPEWQAIRYALHRNIPVRLIDLPQANDLALRKAEETRKLSEDSDATNPDAAPTESEAKMDTANEVSEEIATDPLDWLGRAAGHGDGETWWNRMVEERRDGTSLFAAIQEVMTTLRAEIPRPLSEESARREALREAHMRKCIRAAQKETFENIAVVCGAWHVPALVEMPSAKADNDLLKGLPKVKVAATWAPWTYGRLAAASGYGAGVLSPGWYDFLWKNHQASGTELVIAWISKVARFLRNEDIDCSSAHVIEATRLSDTLAAIRERPAAGLDEMNEAIRAAVCMGDDAPMRLIRSQLIVSERLGRVPPDVPAVPLQRDLEQQHRRLRLKPAALEKEFDLDLRKENDLARSHLLHRLSLLGIPWGEVQATGYGAKGTFHEIWRIQWQPEFAIRVIEASRWGHTISDAATALAIDHAETAESLPALSALVDRVLLANLPRAVEPVTRALENLAAIAGDTSQLLEAIPPLANVFRYGNVRQTDATLVGHVLDGLVARGCIGLAGACASLDDESAAAMRSRVVAVHQAIKLIGNEDHLAQWLPALDRLATPGGAHGLIGGLASRLLFDERPGDAEVTARRVSQALSIGNDPIPAAAWLEGFLHQSGIILLHDDRLWQTVDSWLASLSEERFTHVLPLVRRTFSLFPNNERQQLGHRAQHAPTGPGSTIPGTTVSMDEWNEDRAVKPLPVLYEILGMETGIH